ncbi:hypothetical protein FACS1894218_6750 [Bacilli bacterium]|nr:hypothetical protein FACS1894218_6750 [Bacilli bacterium]
MIGFFFINSGHYNEILGWDDKYYDPEPFGSNHLGGLYSFADIIGNWNAVLAFACIIFAVLGAVINRKTKHVKVVKSKTFLFGGIVSTIVVGVGLLTVVMNSIGNFAYIVGYYKETIPYPD